MTANFKKLLGIQHEIKQLEKRANAQEWQGRQLNKYIYNLQRKLKNLENQIEQCNELKPLHRQFLRLRYIDGLTVRQIAYKTDYSEPHIYRLLKEAENIIEA